MNIKVTIVALAMAAAAQWAIAEGEVTTTETAPTAATAEIAPVTDAIHESFVKLDKNGDGVIDKTEAKADETLAKTFAKIAKEGKLNEESYKAWKSKG